MAKAKVKELGKVVKVHASGIAETDKGVKSMIKANVGDRLVKDLFTKEISIAPKKTTKPKPTEEDEIITQDDVAGDE